MKFEAGFGKADMTAFIRGIGMMGYGQPHNIVKEVATPLMARAMVLNQVIWVHLEQAFASMAIKEALCEKLGLQDLDLIVTAQHTHSAPGGYSHYPFYNFTIPNFQWKVFNTVVSAAMKAVREAKSNVAPVEIFWGTHKISDDKEVAFNRSMVSYLANANAPKFKSHETHLGVNREMEGLVFKSPEGNTRAIMNWFGVHCTSVSSFNQRIHHDNKGVAAALFEQNHPDSTAFFLQAAAGDVSPNFIWDKKLKRTIGKFHDQYESAAFNGEIQFRESEKVPALEKVTGAVLSAHRFKDMAKEVASPAHGLAFFKGTKEGPGIGELFANFLKPICRRVRDRGIKKGDKAFYAAHDPKDILLDHRTGSFLGIPLTVWKRLPPLPDPVVESFRKTAKASALETLPWVPPVLPFQLLQIGQILIALVPGEITTMSARRLVNSLQTEYPALKIIINSYANAYMGYITTPEEYRTQSYEAGHTIYGVGTLEGIISGFRELTPGSYNGATALAFHYPDEELKLRSVLP